MHVAIIYNTQVKGAVNLNTQTLTSHSLNGITPRAGLLP